MSKSQLGLVVCGCLALGAAVGYKVALLREHARLARNKELFRIAVGKLAEQWDFGNPLVSA